MLGSLQEHEQLSWVTVHYFSLAVLVYANLGLELLLVYIHFHEFCPNILLKWDPKQVLPELKQGLMANHQSPACRQAYHSQPPDSVNRETNRIQAASPQNRNKHFSGQPPTGWQFILVLLHVKQRMMGESEEITMIRTRRREKPVLCFIDVFVIQKSLTLPLRRPYVLPPGDGHMISASRIREGHIWSRINH